MERLKGNHISIPVYDYVVFDFETTGTNIYDCEIIEIAAIKVRNDEIVEEFETFVCPVDLIPDSATKINGITNEMVKLAPALEDILQDFIEFIGNDVLVGHNINSFDLNLLYDAALDIYGIIISNDFIDTLTLSQKCINDIENYKLSTICSYFNINNIDAHRALSDTKANHECFQCLKNIDLNNKPIKQKASINAVQKKSRHNVNYTEETKALQTLQGLLIGVTCDGVLTEAEVLGIRSWLSENTHLVGNYPFDKVYIEIEKALEDNILEPIELENLMKCFLELIDPIKANENIVQKNHSLDINGKKICVTGEFDLGSRNIVCERLTELGAIIITAVSKKTNIVIVGNQGSSEWKCGNYGGKIKKAMECNQNGADILIISEDDFFSSLESKVYQNV